MAARRKIIKLNFQETAEFVAVTNPFNEGDVGAVLKLMETVAVDARRSSHGTMHTCGGVAITVDKGTPGETVLIASPNLHNLKDTQMIFAAGVAFARRYMAIANEVTARGTKARPSVKQLNELYEMAKTIDDRMNPDLQRRNFRESFK